jgi:hypothetical protein
VAIATAPKSSPMIIRQADHDVAPVRPLGIATPAPVVLISGGADTLDPVIVPERTQLIGPGLIRTDQAASAVFINGYADVGVTALIGRAAGAMTGPVTLIGEAPEALMQPTEIPLAARSTGAGHLVNFPTSS